MTDLREAWGADFLALYCSEPAQDRRIAWHSATYYSTCRAKPDLQNVADYHQRRVAAVAEKQGEDWYV